MQETWHAGGALRILAAVLLLLALAPGGNAGASDPIAEHPERIPRWWPGFATT
ncbi:MAG: hypothetical protein V1750_09905 [Acidobacteriota bacterium]